MPVMNAKPAVSLLLSAVLLAGCGDGSAGPEPDPAADRIAAAFEDLADSIASGGHEPTSEALRHAADLVRLAGSATPVTITIDGETRDFLAVAEQVDYPLIVCTGPDSGSTAPGGGECVETGTESMRTLIAWEPERMAEVVRIVASPGSTPARGEVPDVMTGLPTYAGSDTVVGGPPPGTAGFSGEYLVRGVGSWWAVSGSQSNDLEREGGACTEPRVSFGWAELGCTLARFRFEFAMEAEAAVWEYLATGERAASGATGSHALAMASTAVDGVRLGVLSWTPPDPGPAPPEYPVDTVTTLQLDVSLGAARDGDDVVLRFRVANPTGEPVTFEFPSGQRYDFSAWTAAGDALWRWSADKSFIMALGHVTLAPGESLEFVERWTPGGATGTVWFVAELTSSNLPVTARAELAL